MKKTMIVINHIIKGLNGLSRLLSYLETFIFSLNFIQLHIVSISPREVYG